MLEVTGCCGPSIRAPTHAKSDDARCCAREVDQQASCRGDLGTESVAIGAAGQSCTPEQDRLAGDINEWVGRFDMPRNISVLI